MVHMRRKQSSISTLTAIIIGSISLSALAENEVLLRESDKYRLVFTKYVLSHQHPQAAALAMRVVDKETGRSRMAIVDGQFRETATCTLSAGIVDGRGIVTGERAHGDQLVIFSLKEPINVLKSVLCVRPSISNRGSRVIYAAEAKRFNVNTHTLVLASIDVDDTTLQTTVIYPRENAMRQSFRPWVDDVADRRVLLSSVSWRPDDQQVAFFERWGDRNEFYLVVLDLMPGAQNIEFRRMRIEVASLLKPEAVTKDEPLPILVKRLVWENNTRIKLFFEHRECLRTQELVIPFSQ